ncbi:MAG: 30S ribosomal protein S4 [Oscillospiraceae bacterium]|nr:30S ribosomal protein S4 [Oscillospiraceae bacterium]
MARYTDAVCRQCRREGQKLFLKGDRCYSDKCAATRRPYPPGQHGQGRKKNSEYGLQLREKQKARRFYGMLESQFSKYFDIAARTRGNTGEKLLRMLEMRLDNVVYRLGFAMSRPEARQLVNHGHFTVNGHKVDIPSCLVRPGDEVALCARSRNIEKIKTTMENNASRVPPKWLSLNQSTQSATVIGVPDREDIDLPVQEHLIVEFYSK